MCAETGDQQQAAYLEKVHEEILYVLECLIEDYTGEAKSELGGILTNSYYKELHEPYRLHIEESINRIANQLMASIHDRDARKRLVKLRRQIRNTMAKLQGQANLYNYADAIECHHGN